MNENEHAILNRMIFRTHPEGTVSFGYTIADGSLDANEFNNTMTESDILTLSDAEFLNKVSEMGEETTSLIICGAISQGIVIGTKVYGAEWVQWALNTDPDFDENSL